MADASNNTFEIARSIDPRISDASQRIHISLERLQGLQIAAGDLIVVRSRDRSDRVNIIQG